MRSVKTATPQLEYKGKKSANLILNQLNLQVSLLGSSVCISSAQKYKFTI